MLMPPFIRLNTAISPRPPPPNPPAVAYIARVYENENGDSANSVSCRQNRKLSNANGIFSKAIFLKVAVLPRNSSTSDRAGRGGGHNKQEKLAIAVFLKKNCTVHFHNEKRTF